MESIVQVLESVMAARDPYTVTHQQAGSPNILGYSTGNGT